MLITFNPCCAKAPCLLRSDKPIWVNFCLKCLFSDILKVKNVDFLSDMCRKTKKNTNVKIMIIRRIWIQILSKIVLKIAELQMVPPIYIHLLRQSRIISGTAILKTFFTRQIQVTRWTDSTAQVRTFTTRSTTPT